MTAVSLTCRRTISRARNYVTTAVFTAAFLAATAVLFMFNLERAEGSRQLLSVIWASSVAPFLPVLVALIGMDVWSDERRTGRMDLLLSVAVRELDLVLGKFLGVWIFSMLVVVLALIAMVSSLMYLAPMTLVGVRSWTFIPALLALMAQGALWSAVSVMFSSMCRQSFVAAALSTVALVALPRGLWEGAIAWSSLGRTAFGMMPLDAHVIDLSSGVFSSGVLITYAIFGVLAIFIAVRVIVLTRFIGKGAAAFRSSTYLSILLAIACAIASATLFNRLSFTVDLPIGPKVSISTRLNNILAETTGHLTITAFLPRKDPVFRSLSQYLRALKRRADQLGSVEVNLRFVDPRWDIGPAERLLRQGAEANSIVFEKGYRSAVVPLSDGFGDTVIASAIQRVALPPQRRDIYWTVGHGEALFDFYGARGMSDIARELARNGYRNVKLDIIHEKAIPQDCALIIIAGAREAFSRFELDCLDAYLKSGGRLLVMLNTTEECGVTAILPTWGIRPVVQPLSGAKTLSGSDVIVSDFSADHPITSGLIGSRLVLEKPISLIPSAAAQGIVGADRLEFVSVAGVASAAMVAAVERGAGAGSDLAVRPTRIVAIGDPSFVMNGQLTQRANANRDFFLNVIAYLSGGEAICSEPIESETLATGLDRAGRARMAMVSALAIPGGVFVLMTLVALRRRKR